MGGAESGGGGVLVGLLGLIHLLPLLRPPLPGPRGTLSIVAPVVGPERTAGGLVVYVGGEGGGAGGDSSPVLGSHLQCAAPCPPTHPGTLVAPQQCAQFHPVVTSDGFVRHRVVKECWRGCITSSISWRCIKKAR